MTDIRKARWKQPHQNSSPYLSHSQAVVISDQFMLGNNRLIGHTEHGHCFLVVQLKPQGKAITQTIMVCNTTFLLLSLPRNAAFCAHAASQDALFHCSNKNQEWDSCPGTLRNYMHVYKLLHPQPNVPPLLQHRLLALSSQNGPLSLPWRQECYCVCFSVKATWMIHLLVWWRNQIDDTMTHSLISETREIPVRHLQGYSLPSTIGLQPFSWQII